MAKVQPVFQNPFEAFNPLTRIDEYLFATAHRFRGAEGRAEKAGACRRGAAARRPVDGGDRRAASRTNFPAGNCSASPWPAR